MEKNKSLWIKEENLKIETERYYDDAEARHDVVKLTYIPTGESVWTDSTRGQVAAYNCSLESLEMKCNEHYVIELTEDFKLTINNRTYQKGKRYIAWLDGECYRITNNDLDYIPEKIAKKIYRIEFKEV